MAACEEESVQCGRIVGLLFQVSYINQQERFWKYLGVGYVFVLSLIINTIGTILKNLTGREVSYQ